MIDAVYTKRFLCKILLRFYFIELHLWRVLHSYRNVFIVRDVIGKRCDAKTILKETHDGYIYDVINIGVLFLDCDDNRIFLSLRYIRDSCIACARKYLRCTLIIL